MIFSYKTYIRPILEYNCTSAWLPYLLKDIDQFGLESVYTQHFFTRSLPVMSQLHLP